MNRKTLIIVLILVAVLVLVLVVYFLMLRPSVENGSGNVIKNEFLENKYYTIKVPDKWGEEDNPGAYSMIINSKEQIEDLNAQKINFRTYYSVVRDALGENNPADYFQNIIDSLKVQFSEIKIVKQEDQDLPAGKVHFIQTEIKQQNIDFAVLLAVFIKDRNVWVISFNTLKSNWDKYQDLFYEIAGSFNIK
jgi:hypothetical protein